MVFELKKCKPRLIIENFATESGVKHMASINFTTDYNIRKRELPHID